MFMPLQAVFDATVRNVLIKCIAIIFVNYILFSQGK